MVPPPHFLYKYKVQLNYNCYNVYFIECLLIDYLIMHILGVASVMNGDGVAINSISIIPLVCMSHIVSLPAQ